MVRTGTAGSRVVPDLAAHDRPRPDADVEWWYANADLEGADGSALGLFAAFFRFRAPPEPGDGAVRHAHSLAFAFCDPARPRYVPSSFVDAALPSLALARLDAGDGPRDPRVRIAVREMLARGSVPAPDRLLSRPARVAALGLDLDYGGNRLLHTPEGGYRLVLSDPAAGTGCDLAFSPTRRARLHGDRGVSPGPDGERMTHLFAPRCRAEGLVAIDGAAPVPVRGTVWYEREHGTRSVPAAGPEPHAWTWASLSLDDGTDATVYLVDRDADGAAVRRGAVVVLASGRETRSDDATMVPVATWRSLRTFREHPVRWRILVPRAGLDLDVEAAFPDQEVRTVLSHGAFWEGCVTARGTRRGRAVAGRGWVERRAPPFPDLDAFFGAVGEEVRARATALLPLEPTDDALRAWVSSPSRPERARDLDGGQVVRALVAPIREVVDRGGKTWRSFALLAAVEAVGGDARRFASLLPLPEVLHVGSLIVDDVEDRSPRRRSGPACHVLFGEARAVNAGCAAYFLSEIPLAALDVPPAAKERVYRLWFEALRAGHVGQALDLDGLSASAALAAATGDARGLERRVLAIARLKTAVPAGTAGRIGAVLGGGTDDEVEAVGCFLEDVGLAFQVADDVLDLKGFEGARKERGGDVREGKATLPIAKALALLPADERMALWAAIAARPTDPAAISDVIARIEGCGALDAALSDARSLVDRAWAAFDPALPDSHAKAMLRAFSLYVLDRHY